MTLNVIPAVLIHRLESGSNLNGVAPIGGAVPSVDVLSNVATVNGKYSLQVPNTPIVPGSLILTFENANPADQNVFQSEGDGKLVHVAGNGSGGTGYVNIQTGSITIKLEDPTEYIGGANNISANYTYGMDSEESIERGRYRKYSGLTDGGLIHIPDSLNQVGFSLRYIYVNIPGMTAITLNVVDMEGHDAGVGTITLTNGNGYRDCGNAGIYVPPRCSFKAVGTGASSAAGEIMFILGDGWRQTHFSTISSGAEKRVI